jgi:hypothetical protein
VPDGKRLVVVSAVTLALLGGVVGVAAGGQRAAQAPAVISSWGFSPLSAARAHRVVTLVSVTLSALGVGVRSSRGPYRAHPTKIAFNYGSYYGAGTKGLWIDHLRWVNWGKPVAYASGLVHARVWPSKRFITTAGGITLDQLRPCSATRSYYTYASMLVPAGFPQSAKSTAYGMSELALIPC